MYVTEINLSRLTHDIYLFLREHFIDRNPSKEKLNYLAVKYIKSWKKNPNMGLVQWLEIQTLWTYEESKDTII